MMGLLSFVVLWMMGVSLSSGFWLKFIAFIFPPYSLYVVVDKLVSVLGWK